MANKHQVLATFDANPGWSSGRIASHLDCCPAYVRATLKRNGRKLMRYAGERGRAADERVARVLRYREEMAQ